MDFITTNIGISRGAIELNPMFGMIGNTIKIIQLIVVVIICVKYPALTIVTVGMLILVVWYYFIIIQPNINIIETM